ncbi:MAG TPA: hypothetical protein VFC00_31720 [Micromonosporaceae bacterium]|nr:hypothetical protein [Micromonosporaceae bacterium]
MGRLLLRLLGMYVRLVWFVLGVLPGHALVLAHSRALAARGRPQSALLPITFYRIIGFVFTTVCVSLVNSVLAWFGGG